MKNDWILIDKEDWAIKTEETLGKTQVPIYVYVNKKTAEIKIFSKRRADEIGLENLKF